jgi:hypothetical protein
LNIEFEHQQHAHCESGVTSNLLNHHGLKISEPMCFGIGAGIFFGHIPFIKVSGVPATTYRIWPGYIFKRVTERLNIKIGIEKFSNTQRGMEALDAKIKDGVPVGMLAGVYYLDYLPEAFRFHFNAHNLIVTGKSETENTYLVSDPVLETTSSISYDALEKARFAKGMPEPKGKMYYIKSMGSEPNYRQAIASGIKQTLFFMQKPPLPWFGVNAIKFLGKKIEQYPNKLTTRQAHLYLGNIIRMQEEIGTGGGGFRYLYAAFLQESAQILNNSALNELSEVYTIIGDKWRNFAYESARVFKNRETNNTKTYTHLKELLFEIGDSEKEFYNLLRKVKI